VMAKRKLEPRRFHSDQEVDDNPTLSNSVINEYKGGERVDWWPATERNLTVLDPEYPMEAKEGEKAVLRRGEREIKYREPIGKLECGVNAFFQIIFNIIKPEQFVSSEDIYRGLTKEFGVLTEEPFCRRYMEYILDKMHERGHVLTHDSKYTTEVPLEGEGRYVELKEDYDPVAYHLVKYIEGGASVREVREYMLSYLGLVEESSTLDWYLGELKDPSDTFDHLGHDPIISEKEGWLEVIDRLPKNR